jgi:hypothetical protein
MRTPEEIEAIRAERAAKRAQPHLTAIYLGVEYPEGTKVWGWDWITKTPVVIGVKVWKATFAEMAFTAYSLLLLALAAIVLWGM